MTHSAPASATHDDARGAFDGRGAYATWLVSVALHALLFVLLVVSERSWSPAMPGNPDAGEDFRSVGVFVKPNESEQDSDADRDAPADEPRENAAPADSARADDRAVPDQPPVELQVPERRDDGLGPGGHPSPPSRAPADVDEQVRDGGNLARLGAGGLQPGETQFFGIKDDGSRIVYAIDVSGSMGGPKLAAAKSRLMSSLETLTPQQQFQILFYNQTVQPMHLGPRKEDVHWATSVNKTLARQYMGSVGVDGGTDREGALRRALALGPQVIYFLTDGDGVELDAARRNRIAKLNNGSTRIHCIEFGEGQPPPSRTALQRLAAENDGAYRFVSVGSLSR
jgi:hypothetical protein